MGPMIEMVVRGFILAIFFSALAFAAEVGLDETCSTGNWQERGEVDVRAGCISSSGRDINFKQIAVDLTSVELKLIGSGDGGKFPDFGSDDSGVKFSSTVREVLSGEHRFVASIGYPRAPDTPVPYGFLRSNGKLVAARDVESKWLKTAIMCVNETKRNSGNTGSRVVIFNAFEDGAPIVLHNRILEEDNCLDAVQVGPRVVEYRERPGVKAAEKSKVGQKYLLFSQGNGDGAGGGFLGYFTIFEDDINLYDIQEFFLTKSAGKEEAMRVAVVLTSGQFSALGWQPDGENAGDRHFFGNAEKKHPVFIAF